MSDEERVERDETRDDEVRTERVERSDRVTDETGPLDKFQWDGEGIVWDDDDEPETEDEKESETNGEAD
jgi:hypothetical protein